MALGILCSFCVWMENSCWKKKLIFGPNIPQRFLYRADVSNGEEKEISRTTCLPRARSFGIFGNKNIFRSIFRLFCSWEQNSRSGNPGIPEWEYLRNKLNAYSIRILITDWSQTNAPQILRGINDFFSFTDAWYWDWHIILFCWEIVRL